MTNPVVLDASALVDLLIAGENASWVIDRITDHSLHAPAHMPAEVLTALHGVLRRGWALPEPAEAVLHRLAGMPIELVDVRDLLGATWVRRDRHSLTDALYVELAARLDTVVVTADRRLARATPLAVAPPG